MDAAGPGQRSGLLDKRLQRVAQGLAPLAEGGLDDRAEQLLVAAQRGAGIPGQADNRGLDLRRGIESPGTHSEEIFNVVPGLEEYGQDAVGLCAGLLGDPLSHLFLHHADHLGYEVPVIDYLEEYL